MIDILLTLCNIVVMQKIAHFNKPELIGLQKCFVYFHIPWISNVSMRFTKQSSNTIQCYLSANSHVVFTFQAMLQSVYKNVLPVHQISSEF